MDPFIAGAVFGVRLRVLDPEVRMTVEAPAGVTVVLGATKIAAGARPAAGGTGPRWTALVNGLPGVVSWGEDGSPLSVPAFTVVGGRIFGIRAVTHPAELALMDVPDPGGRLRP
ncbi:hypothetical protein [Streptomyces sp. NPDC002287]